jgi:tellurium resistance protein TerZ
MELQDIVIETVPGRDLEIALRWDFFEDAGKVDLDAQAVIFDDMGAVADAAFHNQLSACNGKVTHSGDNQTGIGQGDDEVIKADLDGLPSNVSAIAIVVNCYSGGDFSSVKTAEAHIRIGSPEGTKELHHIAIGSLGNSTGLLLCVVHKEQSTNTWKVRKIGKKMTGRNFQDCLDSIREVTDEFKDKSKEETQLYAPTLSKDKVFNMKKDDKATIPSSFGRLFLGLGWDAPGSGVDLDASCVILNDTSVLGTVYFGDKTEPGIMHGGDDTTGEGGGDDERIYVDLSNVAPTANYLFFTVNIYSVGHTFSHIHNSYIRLVDSESGSVLARYALDGSINTQGLIFCCLEKQSGSGSWSMIALGVGCGGRRATDSACRQDIFQQVARFKPGVSIPAAPETEGCCTII